LILLDLLGDLRFHLKRDPFARSAPPSLRRRGSGGGRARGRRRRTSP
jgi:hypothetical protein